MFSKYSKYTSVINNNYRYYFQNRAIMLCELISKYNKKTLGSLKQLAPDHEFFKWYDNLNTDDVIKFSYDVYNLSLTLIFSEVCGRIF